VNLPSQVRLQTESTKKILFLKTKKQKCQPLIAFCLEALLNLAILLYKKEMMGAVLERLNLKQLFFEINGQGCIFLTSNNC